jgi:hypothetical protein
MCFPNYVVEPPNTRLASAPRRAHTVRYAASWQILLAGWFDLPQRFVVDDRVELHTKRLELLT